MTEKKERLFARSKFPWAANGSTGSPQYRVNFFSRGTNGSILIVALWSATLLGSLAISMGANVRQKITLSDRIDNHNFLTGVAEMGVQQGIKNIMELGKRKETYYTFSDALVMSDSEFKGVSLDDGHYTVSYDYPLTLDGGKLTIYGIEDEESKLNLNLAPAKNIRNLFQIVAGLDEEQASVLAYSIVDWRDKNSSISHPDYGAEDDYYEDLAVEYGSKDHAFETMEELLLVREMTREIYDKVQPYVTIFGGQGVNINTTSKEVLLALGFSDPQASKLIAYRAGTDRILRTGDDVAFSDPAAIIDTLARIEIPASAEIARAVDEGTIAVASTFFKIRSRAEWRQKKIALTITVVIDFEGKIYSWKSEILRNMTDKELEEAKAQQEINS